MSDRNQPKTDNDQQPKTNEEHPAPPNNDAEPPIMGDAARVVEEIAPPEPTSETIDIAELNSDQPSSGLEPAVAEEEPAPEGQVAAESKSNDDSDKHSDNETAAGVEAIAESDVQAEAEIVDAAPVSEAKEKGAPVHKAPEIASPQQAKCILECLLFASIEPLSLQRLTNMMSPMSSNEVRSLIVALQGEFDQRNGGLQLVEVGGGWQLATRSAFGEWVLQLQKGRRRPTLSPAALETLAIVAYKQPITRAEVESVRGVDSSGIVRMLQDIELVKVVGRKEVAGRPGLYGTTKKFLLAFGLNSLNDLPSITELKEKANIT